MKALQKLIDETSLDHMRHWKPYVDFFEFDARSRQLSPFTIKVNAERLLLLARWMDAHSIDIETLTRDHIQQYLISLYDLPKKLSDETIAGRIRTYRRFWNVLIEGGMWTRPNPTDGIRKPRISHKVRDTITPTEFERVLGACDKKTFVGFRNYTALLMMWDCMLRRGEVAGLKLESVDLKAGVLTVIGKGNKVRIVPLGSKTIKTLHFYLSKWRSNYNGGYVFCGQQGQPLTLGHIHQMCIRTAHKAGLHMGCHIIRHSSATEYLRRGGQLGLLSQILGHTDISTTSIYMHLLKEDMIRSYDRFSPADSLRV